jgi:hypothetical protein
MNLLTKKKQQEIKSYVIEELIEEYSYNELNAKRSVDKSFFSKLLEKDPEYVCHFDIEYWAKRIMEQDEKIKQFAIA